MVIDCDAAKVVVLEDEGEVRVLRERLEDPRSLSSNLRADAVAADDYYVIKHWEGEGVVGKKKVGEME